MILIRRDRLPRRNKRPASVARLKSRKDTFQRENIPKASPRDSDEGAVPKEPRDRLRERFHALERKLDLGKRERESMSEAERVRRGSALGKAFKLSTELVVAVFVGSFFGWLLDRWMNTPPLFLVVFLLLGIVAGLKNAVREAWRMGDK